jgi:Brp/Blh family beta-carotene 15,15'-monooxygenase
MEANSFQQYSGNPILSRVLLCIGIVLMLWNNYIIPIPENIQWIIFAITILLAGIPHGALDHLVAQQNSTLQHQKFSSIQFYITYLSRMILYGICWYFFPSFSLLLFIVLSAFHFGETDLSLPVTIIKKSATFLQTTYGLLIVLVLLLTHAQEVLPILSLIEKQNGDFLAMIFNTNTSIFILIGILILLLISFFWIHQSHPLSTKWYLTIFIRTVFLLMIIVSLPLPLAFAFYFGCWHSLQSLENIRQHLSNTNAGVISFTGLLKKCIPYSVIAFSGIAILILIATYLKTESVFLFFFFVGIAILTAPHLEVMSHMYEHLRKKDTISA